MIRLNPFPLESRGFLAPISGSSGSPSCRILPVTAHITLPAQMQPDYDSEEELELDEGPLAPAEEEDYPPPGPPGPNEEFEVEKMPYETLKAGSEKQ